MTDRIREYIYSHKSELLETLRTLVEIPSVKGEPKPNAPFGEQPKRALNAFAEICAEAGLAVELVENAVGSADYCPAGEVKLGILCHLDVVPAEPKSWKSDPFSLVERDGVLFGRGVIDDKGPAVAALFAIRCIKELSIPLKGGVRLIFGTDEENGSEDMVLYKAKRALPPMVFTPDGEFPVINIEKGMMRSRFGGKHSGGSVVSFVGGKIPNAVPESAKAVLRGISSEIISAEISRDSSGARFSVSQENGAAVITAEGKSAHASTPQGGINAVTALISLLNRLPLESGEQRDILKGLERVFPFGETDGAAAGLKCSDEKSGALTCVFSIFSMDENGCEGTVDVRFPVCASLKQVEAAEREAFSKAGCEFLGFMGDEPHFVDESSEFVQALLRVYERVEGEKGRCIAIGGGTYVHNIEGGVAFGAERGDTDYHMHGADEWITADELLRDAVLFAEAIAELCG